MAEAELRDMIGNFRVSDLVVLLAFAGRNKTGKKQELQSRALDLLKLKMPAVEMKVRELHNRRYHHQLVARPSNYDLSERTHNDRPSHHYDSHINNNYAPRYNPNVRPTPMNQNPNASYTSAKPYVPPPLLTSTNAVPHFATYADVKFKDLPFYDVLYEIQKPSNLISPHNDRFQEATFYFTLSAQQANDIAISRNASGNYECQILLRFCLLETACEQDDNFPPSINVKVNGKTVQLPNPIPTNRPGVEPKRPSKPVNITPYSKLAPGVNNMVSMSWTATYGRSYVVAIYVARQLTSQTLLNRLKGAGVRNPDLTTSMIREKLQQSQDCEIATTSLRGSLICPLGKIKMDLPSRAITCTHIQCFDANLYIQMNEKKPKWICPVCDQPALFRSLAIDGLFIDIASKVPPDCTEVQFNEDGSWTPIIPKKEVKEEQKTVVENGAKKKPKEVEIVDLSDNDSDEDWNYNAGSQSHTVAEPPIQSVPSAPQLAFLSPDTPALSSSSYVPTPNRLSPFNETMNAVSNIPNDMDPLGILPDIVPTTDISMPSTSSTSPSLDIPQYPHMPLFDPTFSTNISNPFQEQIGLGDNQSMNPAYNNFDFYSLLSIPEGGDSDKPKETPPPDVISLD